MTAEEIAAWAESPEPPAKKPKGGYIKRRTVASLQQFTQPEKLLAELQVLETLPIEAVRETLAGNRYAIMCQGMATAAANGNLNMTRAFKVWLDWADSVLGSKPKGPPIDVTSTGSAAFLPRGEESEE